MSTGSTSEADARRAADEFARERGLVLVGHVLDGDMEPERCASPIYTVLSGFPTEWWVVLAVDEHAEVLRSSTVIGISKRTGVAHLLGDAGDE
jgi:hypothetical protein